NSLSHSIISSTVANVYALAQDGNFVVGETDGIGTANISGGTINVAANVFVGSINTLDSSYDGFASGTMAITGGEINVGVTSPTGGDMVLGGSGLSGFAMGTVMLQGGTLNVTSGSGKIGSAGGTTSFSFTGGTLKVKEYNAGDF